MIFKKYYLFQQLVNCIISSFPWNFAKKNTSLISLSESVGIASHHSTTTPFCHIKETEPVKYATVLRCRTGQKNADGNERTRLWLFFKILSLDDSNHRTVSKSWKLNRFAKLELLLFRNWWFRQTKWLRFVICPW